MTRLRCGTLLVACLTWSLPTPVHADSLILSEFMARNAGPVADEDGDFSDWIELYNAGDSDVDLEGWALTDDEDRSDKWRFPSVVLPANAFLVVFASDKERRDPAGELHTNFKLSGDGEYLALVDPTGRIATEFDPDFGPQVSYASYGIGMDSEVMDLVTEGASAAYLVPTDDRLGLSWTELEYDDGAWARGPTGVGFDEKTSPDFDDLIRTNIAASMLRVNSSVYVRIPFTVEDPSTLSTLLLRVRYEDGLVVFVNGLEVGRRNLRESELAWDSRAQSSRPADEAMTAEEIDISAALAVLETGPNILAIQGLNSSATSSDFLLLPELVGIRVNEVRPGAHLYFSLPTPGRPNGDGVPGIAGSPRFSHETGVFLDAFALELAADPGGEIRYTLDRTAPTELSTLYTGPILVDGMTVVRARVFQEGLLPSPFVTCGYLQLDEGLLDFDSNLPLVVCSTYGRPMGNNCGEGLYTPGYIAVFAPGPDGRTRLTDDVHFADTAGLRKRGASTCSRQKFSFNVEVRDEVDLDKEVEILGFPEDSDYVMYGPYNFDRALMRNALAYWMSREVGRWAARTRFVECFFDVRPGPVTDASYMGVYVFMEKNKRGSERIDVEKLTPLHNEEPMVTGGYVLKRDRIGQGEVSTSAGGYGSLVFVYPKQPTFPQRSYITGYINAAIASLHPGIGAQADSDLIDVPQWLDHHILNWYPKNVDAFRLSGYMFKTRGGPLAMGPVWDYDRTMGCADDDRARDPTGFDNTPSGDGGTRYFEAGGMGSWYSHLFEDRPPTGDSAWARAYRSRWRELRAGPLRTDNILARIDAWADELREAQERNFNRWSAVRPRFGGFQGEIDHLKDWLRERADWIDGQFIEVPVFSEAGGLRTDPLELVLSTTDGEVWYTVNGPDPRLPDGLPAAEAIRYTAPISIVGNTRVWARSRVSERSWSADVRESYYFELMPLVVTEIMYNPPTSTSHQFIEFQNVGQEVLDLNGVRLDDTLAFDFTGSDVTALGPGEFVVIVRDRDAFAEHYGEGIPVAGEFSRTLSRSRMTVNLIGPVDEPLLFFDYDDDWVPSTDGDGYSLVIRDPRGARESWADGESWRASLEMGGSPGRDDGGTPAGLQRPGDINQDGALNITDAVGMLRHLFQGGVVLPCSTEQGNRQLLDINGDEEVNLADAVQTLTYLFQMGAPPALGVDCVPIAGCPASCR